MFRLRFEFEWFKLFRLRFEFEWFKLFRLRFEFGFQFGCEFRGSSPGFRA